MRNITWKRGEIERVPLADAAVDLALLSQALHHASDPAVALAEAALVAHRKRAAQVREDLAKALGRNIDPAKDKEHLRALGQLALESEHLFDEAPNRTFDGLGEAALGTRNLLLYVSS